MDLTFNSRMEAYYQKFIDLQEKLRNSEEERLKLEMKFNEMVQVAKEEEQLHYKKLRSQYKRFLDEDKKRQERNERIIRTLERIEARISMLSSKTERFRMLRRQYQGYLQRISRVKPTEKREDPPPHIVIDKPHEKYVSDINKDLRDADVNKTLGKSNDEKIEILDKYLQSLSSQKCRDAIDNVEKNGYSDLKYLNDVSKRFEKSFDSNRANSIAEEIMNSIYSRHYKKDLVTDDSLKANNFTTSKPLGSDTKTEKFCESGDHNKNNFTSSGLEHEASNNVYNAPSDKHFETYKHSLQKNDVHLATEADRQFRYLNDNMSTPYMDTAATGNDILNKKYISSKPDNTIARKKDSDVRSDSEHDNDSERHYEITSKPPTSYIQDDSKSPLTYVDNDNNNLKANFSMSDKLTIDPIDENRKSSMKGEEYYQDFKRNDSEIDSGLSKAETDVTENEKRINDDKLSIKEKYDSEVELLNKDKEEIAKEIETASIIQDDTVSEEHEVLKNGTNETVGNEEKDFETVKQPDVIKQVNDKDEIDATGHLTKISEITLSEERPMETVFGKQDNQHNEEQDKLQTPHILADEVNKDNVNTDINEYNQDIQYNQYGQPTDYDYDNQIVESMQPQYENICYGGDEQVYDQGIHYDDNGQIVQEEYNEGQGIQIYNENEQSNLYNQQYSDNNQLSQFYGEEHDQNIQQYNQNEQPMNPYDQQYDESGQPIHQYDENGQIIEQYDENGQPINMYNQSLAYDENGQPLYDESGHPTELYSQNQQEGEEYGQSFSQYDANGQEFQQYDNNGEIVQNYGYDTNLAPQYDEGGQPPMQLEETDQIHQDYSESDQQFQPYDDENVHALPQVGESDGIAQQFSRDAAPVPQQGNEFEINDEQQDIEKTKDTERSNLEQSDNIKIEPSTESSQSVIEGDEKGDDAEESVKKPPPKGSNVLDLLDTDTESVKQNTSKISNESDFDFSNG